MTPALHRTAIGYGKSRRRDPAQLIESYPAQAAFALPGPGLFIRLAPGSLPVTDSLRQRHRAPLSIGQDCRGGEPNPLTAMHPQP